MLLFKIKRDGKGKTRLVVNTSNSNINSKINKNLNSSTNNNLNKSTNNSQLADSLRERAQK